MIPQVGLSTFLTSLSLLVIHISLALWPPANIGLNPSKSPWTPSTSGENQRLGPVSSQIICARQRASVIFIFLSCSNLLHSNLGTQVPFFSGPWLPLCRPFASWHSALGYLCVPWTWRAALVPLLAGGRGRAEGQSCAVSYVDVQEFSSSFVCYTVRKVPNQSCLPPNTPQKEIQN